jgi:hypothetical protein
MRIAICLSVPNRPDCWSLRFAAEGETVFLLGGYSEFFLLGDDRYSRPDTEPLNGAELVEHGIGSEQDEMTPVVPQKKSEAFTKFRPPLGLHGQRKRKTGFLRPLLPIESIHSSSLNPGGAKKPYEQARRYYQP